MADYDTIRVSQASSILTVTLHRPEKKNALNSKAYNEITSVLANASADASVRAVILTGSGDYFTSGADLSDSGGMTDKDPASAPVGRFMLAVLRFPKLLIAAVNGPAVGIGVTLLPHCDFCYCSTNATFWTPFVRIAVVPEFCSSLTFPRLFGPPLANEMLLGSKKLTSSEAKATRLVSEVFASEELMEEITKRIISMLNEPLSDISLPLFKKMIKHHSLKELEEAFEFEMTHLGIRAVNGDTKRAVSMLFGKNTKSKL